MKLIFLDRSNLTYKDNAYISSEFEIVLDMVVTQKSNFKVNKDELNVEIGDIAVLQEQDFSYIGIVSSITKNEDKTSKVQLLDFKEIFNTKVPIESFTGDVIALLSNTIKKAFITNIDERQNLKYLVVREETSVLGEFEYEENKLINIKDLIEVITKSYGVYLKYKVEFVRGRFSKIIIIISEVNNRVKLRHDLKAISNLKIKESEEEMINKCIFYPKKENETHKKEVIYYLLTDGTITTNKDDPRRFNYVKVYSEYYGDKDYEGLATKAQSQMVSSASDHQITFTLNMDNRVFRPLSNMFIGYAIEFYGKNKTYFTYVTQIKYKNTFNECYLTLGEQRNTLTDKIKMMDKGGSSSGSQIKVSNNVSDIDGGLY